MSGRVHVCFECGETTDRNGDFCSATCRYAFNNRRKLRGAEIIDLYMAYRFERQLAQQLGLWQAIHRMISNFRAEDVVERQGRKSWRDPRLIMEERPYLKAVATRVRAGR
jgi:predicted nucleic acid-binding Zn ribbon protein